MACCEAQRSSLPLGTRTDAESKRMRTADCVVGGFRYASKGKVVGSLLLGLYDDEGLLITRLLEFNEGEKNS